jgi:hypothetical protein
VTEEDDSREQQLRIELMTVQIDKSRLDMDRVRQEIRMENRKFLVQIIVALIAAFAVGAAWWHISGH